MQSFQGNLPAEEFGQQRLESGFDFLSTNQGRILKNPPDIEPFRAVILALDISVSKTGVAIWGQRMLSGTITPPNKIIEDGITLDVCRSDKLIALRDSVRYLLARFSPEYIVIEDYSFGYGATLIPLAEANGLVRTDIYSYMQRTYPGQERILTVSPGTLKLYMTGNGKASKAEMVKYFNYKYGSIGAKFRVKENDQVDALSLMCLGHHILHKGIAYKSLPQFKEEFKVRKDQNNAHNGDKVPDPE